MRIKGCRFRDLKEEFEMSILNGLCNKYILFMFCRKYYVYVINIVLERF